MQRISHKNVEWLYSIDLGIEILFVIIIIASSLMQKKTIIRDDFTAYTVETKHLFIFIDFHESERFFIH